MFIMERARGLLFHAKIMTLAKLFLVLDNKRLAGLVTLVNGPKLNRRHGKTVVVAKRQNKDEGFHLRLPRL